MKIAVLSDNHVNRSAAPWTWDLARAAFSSARRADHVIVAGDLFDSSGAMLRDLDVVQRYLRRLGLWHPARLSVVPGNHDLYGLTHHGPLLHNLRYRHAGAMYEKFCEWIDDLVPEDARHFSNTPFPFCKNLGDLALVGADTTGKDMWHSANGYWRGEVDRAARALLGGCSARPRVLAIHHPPEEDEERTLVGQALNGYAFGFPPRHFARLEQFVDDADVNAIVCGHIHDNGGAPWSWDVGQRARAHMVGRTGGVHDATPVIGILEVGKRGGMRWRTERI